MKCANCFMTSQRLDDRSSFHTSNVLDNFEHTKRGNLLKSPKLDYDNENESATATRDDHDTYYYANCDASVWMRSCQHEVIEPLNGVVSGNVPKWLKGILLRNGPGNLKVGEYHYQHLFDSSALLHKFGIADGEITYQRRFVQTEVYKRNMAAQRIVLAEFGTCGTPDPCQSIFHRVASLFNPGEMMSDNSMISIYPLGDEYYTFTEIPVIHRIDPKTLETKGKINVSKYVNIVNHTSHPHIMADGTIYNVGMSITALGSRYNVVRFRPNCVIVDDSEQTRELSIFDRATIVASVPSKWLLNPSYMHTFGITENHFIIVEQPLAISFREMTFAHINQKPLMSCLKWHENENTLIHVLSRKTGHTVKTFIAETFFYLHIINQFESRNGKYIVLDICCYRDPTMLQYMYIDSMKKMHGNADFARLFRARPLRFVLPMKQSRCNTPVEFDLSQDDIVVDNELIHRDVITSDSMRNETKKESALRKKPAAQRLPDGRVLVRPELLCDLGCETPRINDLRLGRQYRFFYAISCDIELDNVGTLIKVDTFWKTKKTWQEKGVYPSEPIFVPDPNGKNEDDGVVVSSLIWAEQETRVDLLLLDAVTFTEIARATFDTPGPIPKCLHGWFSLDR